MFVLIKNVHLVGIVNGVCQYKNAQIGQLQNINLLYTQKAVDVMLTGPRTS